MSLADPALTPLDAGAPRGPALAGPQSGDNHRLLAMLEVVDAIATQPSLEAALARCLRSLVGLLGAADAGVLFVYDPARGALSARAAQGYDMAVLETLRLAPGESLGGRAFQSGEAQLYATPEAVAAASANLAPANRRICRRATAGAGQPLSAICVPFHAGGAPAGVLQLESSCPSGRFGPSDLALLQQVIGAIARSVEHIRQREALQAAQAIAQANRLKAESIATLAHEMRTPLTSIKGYASALLIDEATFSPQAQREFFQLIEQECDHLQDLARDLLESSTIEAGFLKIEPRPLQLPRLVRGIVERAAQQAPSHEIAASFPPDFPVVEADPGRVVQVLRNLLDNAVKYSPQGSPIVVRGQVLAGEAVISVADQGVGIAPEHLNRVFDRFFRVSPGSGHHVAGAGVGLAIARAIVESHGGRIWAESQVGQGATFHFTLPLERDHA